MSSASDSITREQRFKFALIISAFAGPLGALIFPIIYLRPDLVLEDCDDKQKRLSDFEQEAPG